MVLQRLGLGAALVLGLLAPAGAVEPAAPPPAKATGPAPAIFVKETTQKGGSVEEGTVLKYHFVVENIGKADLEISNVKPGCGCTVAKWDKLIKPGEKGGIDAQVNTIHFRGDILKHVTVFSNDPMKPEMELQLAAKVTPLIEVNPGVVALVQVGDAPVTQVFTLERPGGKPMKVLQATATAAYLKVEVTPVPGSSSRYQLAVTATMDTPLGRSPVPVMVKTDVEKAENVTVTLIIDRGIITTPPMVFYNVPPGPLKDPVNNLVTVMRQKSPFKVTGATVDDPKLKVSVQEAVPGSEYRVTVSYSGGWDAGLQKKMLTVTTDDPKQPKIEIPVQAFVQAPAPVVAAH